MLNANETPQTLVRLERDEFGDASLDKLVFEPGLTDREGVYFLLLRGRLIWGPDGALVDQVDEPFQVVIDSCFSNLDLSLVTIPNLVNLWYADTVAIDVSRILGQVIPSRECGYPYSFDVALLETNDEGVEMAAALPVEIQFKYDTEAGELWFHIGKCDPMGTNDPFDEECNNGMVPYEKKWTIRMVIGIVQPKGEAYGYVDAPVFIDNPCLKDEVRMEALTPAPIDYLLQDVPYCATYELRVTQKYALCPLEC